MKTKIFKTLCALIFATGISVAQDTYFNVFLGGTDFAPNGTNDMSDPQTTIHLARTAKNRQVYGGQIIR